MLKARECLLAFVFTFGFFSVQAAGAATKIRIHTLDAYARAFGGLHVYGQYRDARGSIVPSNLSWENGPSARRVAPNLYEVSFIDAPPGGGIDYKPGFPSVPNVGRLWATTQNGNYGVAANTNTQIDPEFDFSAIVGPSDRGQIRFATIHSTILPAPFADRNYAVYTPAGYRTGDRLSVIYATDAQNLFTLVKLDQSLAVLTKLGVIRPAILVAVVTEGERRYHDLTAINDPDASQELGGPPGGGALDFLRFLNEELRPFIERTYRPATGRVNTSIVGTSLGGLFAIYASLELPNVFGKFGTLSGSFQLNATPLAVRKGWPANLSWQNQHPYFLDLLNSVTSGGRSPDVRGYISVARTPHDGEFNTRGAVAALSAAGYRIGDGIVFDTFEADGPNPSAHNEYSWWHAYPYALQALVGAHPESSEIGWANGAGEVSDGYRPNFTRHVR